MRILVTGATGFVGRHLIPLLLDAHHELSIIVRDPSRARTFAWQSMVQMYAADLSRPIDRPYQRFGCPQAAIHLAWDGLPRYGESFHLDKNLPSDIMFLESLLRGGLEHILVAGTCFEYGMQSGCLHEALPAAPVNFYGKAKDRLRQFLVQLQREKPFVLQWARLFYLYGPGQNQNSLLAQLDRCIARNEEVFNMSEGRQLRDYLPVTEVARRLSVLVAHPECEGVVNICSGQPVSVLDLVRQRLGAAAQTIRLNLGHFPYSDQEPMAFWGDPSKFLQRCSLVPQDCGAPIEAEVGLS